MSVGELMTIAQTVALRPMALRRGWTLCGERLDTTIKTRREMKASADRWGFLSVAFSIILLVRENYAHASLRMFLSVYDRLAHIDNRV